MWHRHISTRKRGKQQRRSHSTGRRTTQQRRKQCQELATLVRTTQSLADSVEKMLTDSTGLALERKTLETSKKLTNWEKWTPGKKNCLLTVQMKVGDKQPPKEPSKAMLDLINSEKGQANSILQDTISAICLSAEAGQFTGGLYYGLALLFRNGDLVAHDQEINNYFSAGLFTPLEILKKAVPTKTKISDIEMALHMEQNNLTQAQMRDAVKVTYGTTFRANDAHDQTSNMLAFAAMLAGKDTELYNSVAALRRVIGLNKITINETSSKCRLMMPRAFHKFDLLVQRYLRACTIWDPKGTDPPPKLNIDTIINDIELGITFGDIPLGKNTLSFISAYDNGEARHYQGGQDAHGGYEAQPKQKKP